MERLIVKEVKLVRCIDYETRSLLGQPPNTQPGSCTQRKEPMQESLSLVFLGTVVQFPQCPDFRNYNVGYEVHTFIWAFASWMGGSIPEGVAANLTNRPLFPT